MRSDRILTKYKEAFEQLENYDKTRELDIGRKRLDVTLDKKLIKRLRSLSKLKHKAMSRIVEDALKIHLKKYGHN